MFATTPLPFITYFYPIGNTPAFNFLQSVPLEHKATVLLLGCGDVRNIVYTAFADNTPSRDLEVTCVDISPEIIARNILILSLITSDTAKVNEASIWDIYYHVRINSKALALLQTQASHLLEKSDTLQQWHASELGKIFKFTDSHSFGTVKGIWQSYAHTSDDTNDASRAHRQLLQDAVKRALEWKHLQGKGSVITGLRSAGPATFSAANELPGLHNHYWKHGTTDHDKNKIDQAKKINPMFVPFYDKTAVLHYGTDPLLGFHLASAFAPLEKASPLGLNSKPCSSEAAAESARKQFGQWSEAFRLYAQTRLIVRCFVGDALHFCHAMQQDHTSSEGASGLYHDLSHLDPLNFDAEGFPTDTENRSFTVVDTSNLVDHLGFLNVITAAAPLLQNSLHASLFTELLVRK